MTSKLITTKAKGPDTVRLPAPRPCDLDVTTYYNVHLPGYPASLLRHFGKPETTIVTSEVGASVRATATYEGLRYPDLLISFNVDPVACRARNGYVVEEQGKLPDFVLEVASGSTARIDETEKRDDYAALGVAEYWRFDETGGEYHSAALAGERLVNGEYQRIAIISVDTTHFWGHSDVLDLDICWEDGGLRWWDPTAKRYLPTYDELYEERAGEREARLTAEAQRDLEMQARANAEAQRDAAEARVRELEEALRRQQGR